MDRLVNLLAERILSFSHPTFFIPRCGRTFWAPRVSRFIDSRRNARDISSNRDEFSPKIPWVDIDHSRLVQRRRFVLSSVSAGSFEMFSVEKSGKEIRYRKTMYYYDNGYR